MLYGTRWIYNENLEISFVVKLPVKVGFEVLTAASKKMAVFLVVAPCSLVEVYHGSKDL
jgi:hypothetical protein